MAVVRVAKPNPADPSSGLKLLSSGVIVAYGNAIPPSDWEIPEGFTDNSAQDMVVIDWLTPSGYVLSWTGAVFAFGGATPATGFQNTGRFHIWRKLIMNPAGNGQGYEMDVRGRLYRFGPTLPPFVGHHESVTVSGSLAGGIDWGEDIAVDIHMDWSTKRYAILSDRGHLYSPDFTITWNPADVRPLQEGRSLYRALAFTNPAIPVGDTPGYISTYTGRVFSFNSAEVIRAFAAYPDRDVVVDLNVTSDGRAGRPLILELATNFGSRNDLVVSVAPTVVLTQPAATVTTTTRPTIVWSYSDPDGDAQASASVKLYEDTGGSTPIEPPDDGVLVEEWTVTDRGTFTVDPTVDLANGDYWVYARATDTAGDSSAWDVQAFTQNVTLPPAPSVAVVSDPDPWVNAITVTAAGGTAEGLSVHLEYSDDEGEVWGTVAGATAVPYPTSGPKVVDISDWQAPFNRHRIYRAFTVQVDPYITSAASDSISAMVVSDEWVLTDAATGDGMPVSVVPEWSDTRDSGGAAHFPIGRSTAVVTRTGLRSRSMGLTIRTLDHDAYDRLDTLLAAGTTLLLRNPFEDLLFVGVVGDISRSMIDGLAPEPTEVTEMRHAFVWSVSVVEVERPAA